MQPVTSSEYDSAIPMSAGQMRRLLSVAFESIPQQIPEGMAQWLADSSLRPAIERAIEEKRREWLEAHSGIRELGKFHVPTPRTGSYEQHLMELRKTGMVHSDVPEHVAKVRCVGRTDQTAICYLAKLPLELPRLRACLGKVDEWHEIAFMPTYVLSMLEYGLLDNVYDRQLYIFNGADRGTAGFFHLRTVGQQSNWKVSFATLADLTNPKVCVSKPAMLIFSDHLY